MYFARYLLEHQIQAFPVSRAVLPECNWTLRRPILFRFCLLDRVRCLHNNAQPIKTYCSKRHLKLTTLWVCNLWYSFQSREKARDFRISLRLKNSSYCDLCCLVLCKLATRTSFSRSANSFCLSTATAWISNSLVCLTHQFRDEVIWKSNEIPNRLYFWRILRDG